MVFRQHLPMRLDEVIHQIPDLLQIQFGGGVGIEHGRVINVFAPAGQGRFDGEGLNVDVGLHQRGQVGRQAANADRLETIFVYQAGYLNTAALGQVVN